eukprot:gb/GECG01008581.1/.p1 GENE.gb/GECG01008581.1/~~gb/GECG01008581.1/.p1  ORF type:complete len:535 (+),score=60.17 gb/GECG01008581.1/:1-1605(+)
MEISSPESSGGGLHHQFTGDSTLTDESNRQPSSGAESYEMPEDEEESSVDEEAGTFTALVEEIDRQLGLSSFGDTDENSTSRYNLQHSSSIWSSDHDQTNCTVTSLKHVQDLLAQRLARIKDVLCIDPDDAIPLLLQHSFDDGKVTEKWSEGKFKGITLGKRPAPEADTLEMCPITLEDDVPMSECDALPCGHYVSNEAWGQYLENSIESGPGCIYVDCPVDDCEERVRRSVIKRHCDASQLKKYDWYLLDALLSTAPYIKHCPNPRCSLIVVGKEAEKPSTVVCYCGYAYCFCCLNDVHIPVPCHYAKEWLNTFIEDYTPAWLETNTKMCPNQNCGQPIEKNQGCDHMYCDPKAGGCGTRFNWSEASTTRLSNMGARTHRLYADHVQYANRFVEENKNERLLRLEIETAEDVVKDLVEKRGLELSDVSVLVKAFGLLTKGTRILKWSYVYDYYQSEKEGGTALIQHWREQTNDIFRDLKVTAHIGPEKQFLQGRATLSQIQKHLSDLCEVVQKTSSSLWSLVDGIEDHAAINV